MQQSCATLNYDLNTMKGIAVRYLKKLQGHSKQYSFKTEKLHLVVQVSKKQKTVMGHFKHLGCSSVQLKVDKKFHLFVWFFASHEQQSLELPLQTEETQAVSEV